MGLLCGLRFGELGPFLVSWCAVGVLAQPFDVDGLQARLALVVAPSLHAHQLHGHHAAGDGRLVDGVDLVRAQPAARFHLDLGRHAAFIGEHRLFVLDPQGVVRRPSFAHSLVSPLLRLQPQQPASPHRGRRTMQGVGNHARRPLLPVFGLAPLTDSARAISVMPGRLPLGPLAVLVAEGGRSRLERVGLDARLSGPLVAVAAESLGAIGRPLLGAVVLVLDLAAEPHGPIFRSRRPARSDEAFLLAGPLVPGPLELRVLLGGEHAVNSRSQGVDAKFVVLGRIRCVHHALVVLFHAFFPFMGRKGPRPAVLNPLAGQLSKTNSPHHYKCLAGRQCSIFLGIFPK